MTVIYFGSSAFSVPPLKSIKSSVSLVVTKKTKPKGRGYLLEDNEVKQAATSLGLPLIEIGSFKDEAAEEIGRMRPDLVVVASFGLIIPKWFLDIPTVGSINVHPSLLPKYRGPSPIQWAVWNGEAETGITIIKMSEKMDAGDVVYQEKMGVDPEDDAATLSEKLSGRAAQILPGIVENVGINGVNGIPQQDEEATYTPMINKEMGKLDWNGRSGEIARQVRALVTWPTAYTFIDGKMLKIFKVGTGEEDTSKKEPGTVIDAGKEGVRIVTGDGSLFLKEVQLENRKKMSALDFTRGYRDIVGKQLK